jgi:hypothetical protein
VTPRTDPPSKRPLTPNVQFWVALALAIGAILVVAGWFALPLRHSDFWFEAAKAGLELAIVATLGGLVGYALKNAETERAAEQRSLEADRVTQQEAASRREQEERAELRRVDDYRLGLRRGMVTAYNDIKAIRRTLRAYGFRSPESGATLSSAQVEEFRTEMDALISAQLSLETIQREVEAQEQAFAGDAPELVDALHRAQSYVNDVIDDWETFGVKIRADMDAGEVTHLEKLQEFLAPAQESSFKAELSEPLDEASKILLLHHLAGRRVRAPSSAAPAQREDPAAARAASEEQSPRPTTRTDPEAR